MAKMAKDESAARMAKLARLIEVGRDLHGKMGALLEELADVSGGGHGLAADVKAAEQAFDTLWCGRYAPGAHGRYLWRSTIDKPNLKRLIKALGLAELQARMFAYLASDEPFVLKHRHPFGLFVSGINSYAGAAVPPAGSDFALEAPTVADCKHDPRCTSDQQHTARRMKELRS